MSLSRHLFRSDHSDGKLLMTTVKKKPNQSAEAKIINVAKKLFSEKGFAGTSISDLAKAAEINQSLIYHYFENKEALWRRVKHDELIQ